MEALQSIQKEKESLEASIKDLNDGKDVLEEKKMAKNELTLKREVRGWSALFSMTVLMPFSRGYASNCPMPRKNSIVQSVMLKRNGTQANKL